ncbi:hypothetical protein [Xylanimonas ulmi]|uniref:hypothetical protein n=1 Tax=Xylanimonas ulmi TaxID=228973 RepID=UPI001F5ED212|nr:hypothetical protein [Xylanibacterium ulmi]
MTTAMAEQHGVEVRALQPLAQRRLGPAAEHVVVADDVREEDRVEPAVLQELREIGPVPDVRPVE